MKELLRIAAEREHRTLSNMIETLVINYCESRGIPVEPGAKGASRAKKRTTTTTDE